MEKNKKTIVVLAIMLAVAALAVVAVFRAEREELIDDVEVVEFDEAGTLDLVGPGDDIIDIEEDLRRLDEELESASDLLDGLDAELERL